MKIDASNIVGMKVEYAKGALMNIYMNTETGQIKYVHADVYVKSDENDKYKLIVTATIKRNETHTN